MLTLAPDTIFDVITDAGGKLLGKGDKRTLLCILHDEKRPSAYAVGSTNAYGCAVCFAGGAIGAKQLAERKGLDWSNYRDRCTTDGNPAATVAREPLFTRDDAHFVWSASRARMLDDRYAEADQPVYDYLHKRGLGEAWDLRLYGILSMDMPLHDAVGYWPARGYRLVVPLYDRLGRTCSVQARAICDAEPRVLVPKGSQMAGSLFANESALALLRGEPSTHDAVIFGEGLTDFLGLSISAGMPVFCAPGTSNAVQAVGDWVRGRTLLTALDCDEAADRVMPAVLRAAFEIGVKRTRSLRWTGGAKDACDYVAQHGIVGLSRAIKKTLAKEWQ